MGRLTVAALALALAAAGCGPQLTTETESVPDPDVRQVLDRWDAADLAAPRFLPLGPLTSWGPEWDLPMSTATLYDGFVEPAPGVALPAGPQRGIIRWPGGAELDVPLLTARQALADLQESAQWCPGCQGGAPIRLTGAEPVTAEILTDRGTATVPAWSFTVEGGAVRITRVAVTPGGPGDPSGGARLGPRYVTPGPDDRTLTVRFQGRAEGDGPCTADYPARAAESRYAAVVVLSEIRTSAPGSACATVLHPRTVTVTLTEPLGRRVLLDVGGRPVRVERR
ncbi:MAG TPA: hypothetical protein VGD67_18175 [Pseudonocardiaceae bacterium]